MDSIRRAQLQLELDRTLDAQGTALDDIAEQSDPRPSGDPWQEIERRRCRSRSLEEARKAYSRAKSRERRLRKLLTLVDLQYRWSEKRFGRE